MYIDAAAIEQLEPLGETADDVGEVIARFLLADAMHDHDTDPLRRSDDGRRRTVDPFDKPPQLGGAGSLIRSTWTSSSTIWLGIGSKRGCQLLAAA